MSLLINPKTFEHMQTLPLHKNLCTELLNFFGAQSEINAGFLSGSAVTGGMDFHSDLDLGFVCADKTTKEKIWSQRWDWALPPWFHRMDADHIKDDFVIYLFEPHIHVDLCFYTMDNLPAQFGGPYTVAFDKKAQLNEWIQNVNAPLIREADWTDVVHEEERFWTWAHYAWGHVGRGEYYDIATHFAFLRDIPHKWHARLGGSDTVNTRRMEQRGETDFIKDMSLSHPAPDKHSLKTALLNLIRVHHGQRGQVDKILRPQWKTTPEAREKITRLIEEMR
jgi:hypothetical protein